MKIDVTQEDINQGTCFDSEKCPVALALKRKLPGKRIVVAATSFLIEKSVLPFPPKVEIFVRCFDNKEIVYPFTFEL